LKVFNFKFSRSVQCLIVVVIMAMAGSAHAAAWQWIDGVRVQNRMKEGSGLWLIDVRSASGYQASHIEGSVNIPADALTNKKFGAKKMLVLVDDSLGQRFARQAADMLVKKGQERVSVLEGGISGWKTEGLPLVETKAGVRGVTADELKWALHEAVSLKIYDLRDEKEVKRGTISGSQAIAGKSVSERIEKLRSIIGGEKKKDLASRMKKQQPVLVVFAVSEDAEGHMRKIQQGIKGDIRYLIGGYEATVAGKLRHQKKSGSCPTCPGTKKTQ
jgi:rhodanese-related sulfurtransferase